MADDSKHENIDNQTETPTQQIQRLQNELNTLTIELRSQKQTNSVNINELQTLQSKYDSLANQTPRTHTMNDVFLHQQNVDELATLQLKYDELVEENHETMEAMSQLITASNNKINTAKREMDKKYKILYNEKQSLLKTIKSLTDSKQLISNQYNESIIEIEALNNKLLNQNNDIEMDINNSVSELELIIESKDKQCEELKHKMGILKEEYESLESKYEKLKKYKESFSKYKEKAKNVVNKHKSKAENQINAMRLQLDEMNEKYEILLNKHEIMNKNTTTVNKQNETLNTQQINLSENITQITAEKITVESRLDKYIKNLEITKNKLKKYKIDNDELNKRINQFQNDIQTKDEQYELLNKSKDLLNKRINQLQKDIQIKNEQLLTHSKNRQIVPVPITTLVSSKDELTLKQLKNEKKLLSNNISSLSKECENLRIQNEQLQSWQNNMNSNVMSLNNKVMSKEGLIDKLSKHNTSLQKINDEFEIKVKTMFQKEIQLKNKLDAQSKIRDKREQMLNKISVLLTKCSLFKDEKNVLSVSVGVSKLIDNYENLMNKYNVIMDLNKRQVGLVDRHKDDYNNLLKQLSQKDEKMKKFAIKIKKMQTQRNELQMNMENMKDKLTKAVTDSELYEKLLTNIHNETKITLEKYAEMDGIFDDSKTSNVLTDCRSLHQHFISVLELYLKVKNEKEKVKVCWNEFEALKRDLSLRNEEIIGYKKELDESGKYIHKLSKKLNHCIKCIKENWHYDITKTDLSDLSVSTRLVLEDKIWCLVRWRKNKMEIKHNDEYFWCEQKMFLKKLGVDEHEIYLPDLFENKFENQIISNLENKWKGIQRRTDNEIKELKLQKTQREDKLKQYKSVLQKQKDKLLEAKEQIKELNTFRDEAMKLRNQLSNLSNENINYSEKYSSIEKKLSNQTIDFQNKKLQIAEIENKLLLKERELSLIKDKFNTEKQELESKYEIERTKFKSDKSKCKKYYDSKLEDIKLKTHEMLSEKNKQILILENKMNTIKYNKQTQTEYAIDIESKTDVYENKEINDYDFINNNMNNQQMSIYNIINQPNTAERDAQIKGIHQRLGRLQELLRESEEQHQLKDQELEYLKQIAMSTPQPEDNPDVNTQYLKNSLLQFFDEKINVKQLLSVATVGLRFDDDDLKKAQNSKLIANQSKSKSSWW